MIPFLAKFFVSIMLLSMGFMASDTLNPKQKRFVEEYGVDSNARQAAIRAGYSEKTAQEQGSRLLSNVKVKKALDKATKAISKKIGITQQMVLEELALIGFGNITDVMSWDKHGNGTFKTSEELDAKGRALIKSIKVKETLSDSGFTRTKELTLNDKIAALEKIGRHLGMFKDQLDLNLKKIVFNVAIGKDGTITKEQFDFPTDDEVVDEIYNRLITNKGAEDGKSET